MRSDFEVNSIYYLSPAKGNNTIQVLRFIEDRLTKPIRAYYLFEPYTITFAQALSIRENKIQLSNPENEEKERNEYEKRIGVLRFQHAEEIRITEEARVKEEKEDAEEIVRREAVRMKNNAERVKQNEKNKNVWGKPKEIPVANEKSKSLSDARRLELLMNEFRGG